MRFGLISPVASLLPGVSAWEEAAGPDELRRAAEAADRLGYEYVTCSEHVVVPRDDVQHRGPRFYDPVATLGFLAAVTTRIKLLTHVVVLPYHHPLEIAKRFGTVDRLSGGRLLLGVGVGTLRAEFELLEIPFDDRGARYEDQLRAIRAALGRREPVHDGPFHRFKDVVVDPCALQERVPIWLGGRTPRSLRRALQLGDGWVPFGLSPEQVGTLLGRARDRGALDQPFEVALPVEVPADLETRIGEIADRVARLRSAGATVASLTVRARSATHYVEQLELFRSRIATL